VSIKLGTKLGRKPKREDLLEAWAEFRPLAGQGLPTAPAQPVFFAKQDDRPQPRLDCNREHGMAATVGRLRECGLLDWKFVVLSHNTVRGAAGATILNAELLASLGKLEQAAPPDRSGSLQRKKAIEVGDAIAAGVSAILG
jgi:aspartate-semialdehyde dehydrogenase